MTPDREKVIKELESLRNICNAKSNMAIGKGKVAWAGYANTADDALKLLKEQEPSKPTVSENAYGVNFYYCPRCARPILKSAAYGHPRYCEDCGKGLIWDD